MDNGLCTSHNKYYGPEDLKGVSKPTQPAKPVKKARKLINKRSRKMTTVMSEVKKLYSLFLKKNTTCQVNTDECTRVATDVHHRKGRGKNQIADATTWMAVCRSCHNRIESDDAWARKMGYKISKVKINGSKD
jgi:hypothetical protein